MRWGFGFAVAFALVTSISGITSAQTCTHYGGYTHWAGNLDLYFQEGSQIVDVSDPQHPTIVGGVAGTAETGREFR